MNITDVTFNGVGFMLAGDGLAYVASALPAAASTGGGAQYADNSPWSSEVYEQFNLGVGFEDAGGGKMRYSTLDTSRLANTVLPQKSVEKSTTGFDAAANTYFTTYNAVEYAVNGLNLYRLDGGTTWTQVASLGGTADAQGIAAYDGWFHIARGGLEPYTAVDIGTLTTVTAGPYNAELVYAWGGWIFAAFGNQLFYAAGGNTDCNTVSPDPSILQVGGVGPGWVWTQIDLGPCDNLEVITGLQGMYVGSLSATRLFISTTRQLYMVLPGDIAVSGLLEWPFAGRDMTAWRNELYIPVSDGLTRYSPSGSTFQVGLDLNYGLPAAKRGPVLFQEGSPRGLLAAVQDTVYAYDGEGWRFIVDVDDTITGLHYTGVNDALYVAYGDKIVCVPLKPYGSQVQGPFELTGYLETGESYGGLRLLEKDYHEIVVNGVIPTGTSIKVEYSLDGGAYVEAGTVTADAQVLSFPCNGATRPKGKRMQLRVTLTTADENVTPELHAVVLRFLPYVVDRRRWTYTFNLPRDCLLDSCHNPVADYNQDTWRCAIEKAIGGVSPVAFVDYDGRQYSVAVTDWNYLLFNREAIAGAVKYDLHYTLSLLETCGDSFGTGCA